MASWQGSGSRSPIEEHSQEDEHSCFSDNTTADIVGNATGIQMVYLGGEGNGAGPGIDDLVAAVDSDLAARLGEEIEFSVTMAGAIPAPFDRSVAPGCPMMTRAGSPSLTPSTPWRSKRTPWSKRPPLSVSS